VNTGQDRTATTVRAIESDQQTPPTPASAPVGKGDSIAGRYRLVTLLARGGMAEVWEALDEVLTRPVAVKILLPHLASDQAFVTRFRREAIAAARLSDPHIVSIYDTCSRNGVEAIVMELVRGSTLRDVLDQRGALNTAQAVDIASQVATALEHAHRNGLVHRDVKPGNILLSQDGRVLVTDFGIAKAAEATSDLTEVGQVVGTAKYLSPEQVRGTAVDARSDVYALGIVLYEMLCGRVPFLAENSTATAVARLTSVPLRPRQLRAAIPRQLEQVVLTAMALDPGERQQTAAALRDALRAIDLRDVDDDGADATETVGVSLPLDSDPTPVPGDLEDDVDEDDDEPGFARRERSWLIPVALILVIALTLGVVAVVLERSDPAGDLVDGVGGDDPPAVQPEPGAALALAGDPEAFDPEGDGDENDEDLPNILDGDPGTEWRTERYDARSLPPLKRGVGIVLPLAETAALGSLEIESPSQGWAAQIFVGDGTESELEDWDVLADAQTGIDGNATFDLRGFEGSAVLVWITDLGDGSVGPRYSTTITGATVLG
jgi:eukaryotic-like serine/threonine-protein kinase